MSPLLISLVAFFGVAALVGAVAMLLQDRTDKSHEDRLAAFTGLQSLAAKDNKKKATLLSEPLSARPNFVEATLKRFSNLSLIFEQANTKLTPTSFLVVSGLLAGGAFLAGMTAGLPWAFLPLLAPVAGLIPLGYLLFVRRRRLKSFQAQLPDALELIARALRAGHSLAAGFSLVAQEMTDPIGTEFGRVFEEQNLGISLDEALQNVTQRVPNLDLKFFATSVVLQRQTGGDLAEILDKIGHLVRERFKIYGQVQALTGEGRLSGVVLLGLPPVLFLAVYRLNPDYIMALFTDPMGKKMLAGAVFLQFLGALVIRKIVNIKV